MSPMKRPFKYDVFISYSSHDLPWAEKLFSSLERRGIEPFFDRSRLEPGATWRPQLQEGIRASRHILALWSENAHWSSWVQRELATFQTAAIDMPDTHHKNADRRMLFLLLKGTPDAYDEYQMIPDLQAEQVYAEPVGNVDQGLWERVVDKIYSATGIKNSGIPVPVVILTLTQEQFYRLKPEDQPWLAEKPLGEYIQTLGIGTMDDLAPFYGAKREEWRPFGSDTDIWAMLGRLRDEINEVLKVDANGHSNAPQHKGFYWELIQENFWSDDDPKGIENGVRNLQGDSPSVVIVDPISLYDDAVGRRFDRLSYELMNSRVAFITLLPLQCWSTHKNVREQMRRMTPALFQHLYKPDFGNFRTLDRWSCDVNIGDQMDIRRTLLPVLKRHLSSGQSKFLQHHEGDEDVY